MNLPMVDYNRTCAQIPVDNDVITALVNGISYNLDISVSSKRANHNPFVCNAIPHYQYFHKPYNLLKVVLMPVVHQFGHTAKLQLCLDVLTMAVDGAWRKIQLRCNLISLHIIDYETEHLHLTI